MTHCKSQNDVDFDRKFDSALMILLATTISCFLGCGEAKNSSPLIGMQDTLGNQVRNPSEPSSSATPSNPTSDCLDAGNNENCKETKPTTNKSTVTTYPFPESMPSANDYQVWANGKKVPVWKADGSKTYDNVSYWEEDGGKAIANFAFSGSVKVRVKYKKDFDFATVHPEKYGITAKKVSSDEVELTLNNHQQSKVILRIDGNPSEELFIFGDPPVPAIPEGAIVYEAGRHDFKNQILYVSSNQTHYLKPGAVLHARVIVQPNSHNVRFMGPGVVVATYQGWLKHNFIVETNCSNVSLEDFILTNNNMPDHRPEDGGWLDSQQLVIFGMGGHDISVKNVKTLGDYKTSDALTLSGKNVTVRDCFLTSADNCIVIGNKGNTENVTLERNVIHQWRYYYTSTIFPQGSPFADDTPTISNVHFKDLYVVQTMGTFIGCRWGNSFTGIYDFLIENVWIERLHVYGSPYEDWAKSVNAHRFFVIDKVPTETCNLTLRNVHWPDSKNNEGWLNAKWNVTFEKVYYKGNLVKTKSQAAIQENGGTLTIKN